MAKKNNRKIRMVGSGHSPSDIACTDDIMISLSNLNRILEVNHQTNEVKVEAGITISKLNEQLLRHGLAISNLGSISDQTIAGAISTGTHGTGISFGILATMITSLEVITADGSLVGCSEKINGELFKAALCSLGCLGIIVTVTLKVEKAFKLHAIQAPSKLQDVLKDLDKLVKENQHFRFWWFPHTQNVITWAANRTEKRSVPILENWFQDRFLGYHLLEFLLYLSTFVPSSVPSLNTAYFQLLFSKLNEKVDQSFKVFNFDCLFKQYVTEWAIPIENTAEALIALEKFIESHDIKAHFPVEVRFVKKDEIPLSPAYGRDTCFIGIIMYRPYGQDTPIEKYWTGYTEIMQKYNGRPHWAKAYELTPDQLEKVYPKMEDFLTIRQQLDPNQMFVNDYIARHLLGKRKLKSKL